MENPETMSQGNPDSIGDILEDIFSGKFLTPKVKVSEDLLRNATPVVAFEEFKMLQQNPALFFMFYQDVKERQMLESLHFILEVEEYMALPEEFRLVRESEIISTYITRGCVSEINVPDGPRKMIEEKKGAALIDIFLEAQKFITHMLIRNVDSTWSYKKNPPTKPLKPKELKKVVDHCSDVERIRDLLYYFTTKRITPLMYQARTSVSSLQRKVKTVVPVGTIVVDKIELAELQIKTSSPLSFYGKVFYKNSAGVVQDKKIKEKTSPKKMVNNLYTWEDKLPFEVRDFDSQGLEFILMEKKFTSSVAIGWSSSLLKELIPSISEESKTNLKLDLLGPEEKPLGKVSFDLYYVPDKAELERREKERQEREAKNRATASPEFDFLF
eukprot:TRINITY_DN4262_c0_g3_i1.p1 TRINITY_DN4262_c0_g3~~TRINITY_DN4262_c0_g3_i1.p1  ORF type:complete len:385 (-),score=109.60 TRINITY_DN4262_c0_g3_i1:58-1212(-)